MTWTDLLLSPLKFVTFLIDLSVAALNVLFGLATIIVSSIGCLAVAAVVLFCIIICSAGF